MYNQTCNVEMNNDSVIVIIIIISSLLLCSVIRKYQQGNLSATHMTSYQTFLLSLLSTVPSWVVFKPTIGGPPFTKY